MAIPVTEHEAAYQAPSPSQKAPGTGCSGHSLRDAKPATSPTPSVDFVSMTGLTRIQRSALVKMLMLAPEPARGGRPPAPINSATGGSLVGRGLAELVDVPGDRRPCYRLTSAGKAEARHLRNKELERTL